ncbi:pleiotropic regulatory protein RsmS [Aeromonas veronii]|uniref:pleiotropic regulatory protein RsmS n=1 Tax=Aeromonas TaxID=642 RepID=UPI0032EC0F58
MSLENAPPEIKLAVDLIELLETNDIDPALALAALAIVQRDYERKIQQAAHTQAASTDPDRGGSAG